MTAGPQLPVRKRREIPSWARWFMAGLMVLGIIATGGIQALGAVFLVLGLVLLAFAVPMVFGLSMAHANSYKQSLLLPFDRRMHSDAGDARRTVSAGIHVISVMILAGGILLGWASGCATWAASSNLLPESLLPHDLPCHRRSATRGGRLAPADVAGGAPSGTRLSPVGA